MPVSARRDLIDLHSSIYIVLIGCSITHEYMLIMLHIHFYTLPTLPVGTKAVFGGIFGKVKIP